MPWPSALTLLCTWTGREGPSDADRRRDALTALAASGTLTVAPDASDVTRRSASAHWAVSAAEHTETSTRSLCTWWAAPPYCITGWASSTPEAALCTSCARTQLAASHTAPWWNVPTAAMHGLRTYSPARPSTAERHRARSARLLQPTPAGSCSRCGVSTIDPSVAGWASACAVSAVAAGQGESAVASWGCACNHSVDAQLRVDEVAGSRRNELELTAGTHGPPCTS